MWQKETKNMECCTDLTLWKHPSFILQCIQYTRMLSLCQVVFIPSLKKKSESQPISLFKQVTTLRKYSTSHGYDGIPWHQALSPLSLFILSDLPIPITYKYHFMLMTCEFLMPTQTTPWGPDSCKCLFDPSTWMRHRCLKLSISQTRLSSVHQQNVV